MCCWFNDSWIVESPFSRTRGLEFFTCQTARAVHAIRFDWLSTNFGHDVSLAAQIFVAQRQEIVYHEGFVAITDGEKVNVNAFRVEKQQTDP